MELTLEIVNKLSIALIGVSLYYLIKFIPHLSTEKIQTKVFWSAMWLTARIKVIWLFLTLSLIAIIVVKIPSIAESIKQSFGLDITNNIASFFTLGLTLAGMIDNNPQKPKI